MYKGQAVQNPSDASHKHPPLISLTAQDDNDRFHACAMHVLAARESNTFCSSKHKLRQPMCKRCSSTQQQTPKLSAATQPVCSSSVAATVLCCLCLSAAQARSSVCSWHAKAESCDLFLLSKAIGPSMVCARSTKHCSSAFLCI